MLSILAAEAPALGLEQWAGLLVSYLLGSVPFGLLLGFLRGVDIRKVGSGNIGATNVGRALGRPMALLAFGLDFMKGWLPSFWLAHFLAATPQDAWLLAVLFGGAGTIGHVWPVFLRFKGGKGVATGCGAVVGIDPFIFLGAGAVWLVTLALSRYVSLASLCMGLAFPIVAWLRMQGQGFGMETIAGTGALMLLIFMRHSENVKRLLAGTESKIGGPRAVPESTSPKNGEDS
jgi:glycerol-3-phosphate acyltransferase PlsY